MKLISLNTWGGRAGKEKLLEFFRTHKNTDILCLQEIWSAPQEHLEGIMAGGRKLTNDEVMVYGKQEITDLFSDHVAYFHPQYRNDYGLLILIHKQYKIMDVGEVFVHLHKGYEPDSVEEVGTHARNIQYVTIDREEGPITIVNFHGLWNGRGKMDTEDRIIQSQKIKEFMDSVGGEKILCGDFNLRPDTESVKILEQEMKNLIKEHNIESTRTSLYTKPEKYADYIFVSPDLRIQDFRVLPDEVSDHAALYLEFK